MNYPTYPHASELSEPERDADPTNEEPRGPEAFVENLSPEQFEQLFEMVTEKAAGETRLKYAMDVARSIPGVEYEGVEDFLNAADEVNQKLKNTVK